MQQALTEMNVQLANVISDISGKTGLAILRALGNGERDPQVLSQFRHESIHASRQEIARSLEGNWRNELLFALEQNLALYDIYQLKIAECDERIARQLKTMEPKNQPEQPQGDASRPSRRKHAPEFYLREQLCRIAGVDLTQIDGIQARTAQTVISEVGVDMSRWRTEKQFASWLGLCPDNRISGGKVLKR
jgi:transposase